MIDSLRDPQAFFQHPFPHVAVACALGEERSELVLSWLESTAPWNLKLADFYEQYEFSLAAVQLPENLKAIFGIRAIGTLRSCIEDAFGTKLSGRYEITAHKLVQGQRIRIHNDYIPGQETHRILLQLNRGWHDENGGALLFFGSHDSQDLRKAFKPVHDSCLAFEISPLSHHAVTPIVDGERYTLVFSFYRD
jgi:Rps23 Pro-64 3,4-dihydroxylase Tpa1-like proline 4-hydroxylase